MLVAGVKVPCEVWTAYASARQDYLNKSQPVFDQLAQKGITIEQVVYSGGQPRPDSSDPSKYMTVQIQAPLRPPAFLGLDSQCPGLPLMAGFGGATAGWQPVPITLGAVEHSIIAGLAAAAAASAILLLSGGTLLGVAGYGAFKTYKQVSVMLDAFDTSPTRILAAYTTCVATYVKNGLAVTDAGNRCAAAQTSAQQYGIEKAKLAAEAAGGLGFWGWLGVGAGVLILGTIVVRYMRSRAGAVTRLIAPVGGYDDGVALGELYFRPRGRRRGRR
jgi:hypothetical protein